MKLFNRQRSSRGLLLALGLLLGSQPLWANSAAHDNTPSAGAMVADLLVARPLLIGMTVLGTGLFIISLPFSALGGNSGEAADMLVVGPAQNAFVRCLGCSTGTRQPSKPASETAAQ